MTRNFVPRQDNEGCLGLEDRRWANIFANTGYFENIVSPVIDVINNSLENMSNGLVESNNSISSMRESLDNVYENLGSIADIFPTLATLDSPALTGTPTAPTPNSLDNSNKIATTAYVDKIFSKGATFYVNINGSADGDGSIGNPFNSIQRAIDACSSLSGNTMYADSNSGERIIIKAGNYDGFTIANKSIIIESEGKVRCTSPIKLIDRANLYCNTKLEIDFSSKQTALYIDGISFAHFIQDVEINAKGVGLLINDGSTVKANGEFYFTTSLDGIDIENNSHLIISNAVDVNSDTGYGIKVANSSSAVINGKILAVGFKDAIRVENCSSLYNEGIVDLGASSGYGIAIFNNSSAVFNGDVKSKVYVNGADYNIFLKSSKLYIENMELTNGKMYGICLRQGSIFSCGTAVYININDEKGVFTGSMVMN